MKRTGILLILIVNFYVCFSQTKPDDIINHPDIYLYGEGFGETLEIADKNAVADLAGQLRINVVAQSQLQYKNEQSVYQSNIKVNSDLFLTNLSRAVERKKKVYHVIRYLDKQVLQQERKRKLTKVLFYADKAEKALETYNVNDALKYYYCALNLTVNDWRISSAQNTEGVMYVDIFGDRINKMLSDIDFQVERIAYSAYKIYPVFRDTLLKDIRYSYDEKLRLSQVVKDNLLILEDTVKTFIFEIDFQTFHGVILEEEDKVMLKQVDIKVNAYKIVDISNIPKTGVKVFTRQDYDSVLSRSNLKGAQLAGEIAVLKWRMANYRGRVLKPEEIEQEQQVRKKAEEIYKKAEEIKNKKTIKW